MSILTVNAGSSSVKLAVVDGDDTVLAERELEAPDARVDPARLRAALGELTGDVTAVAHRIVHGGERFREAVVIEDGVVAALHELTDLAPLHQPKSLAALAAVSEQVPDLPAVACFDTAFHATLPAAAYTYALPARWRERWGLRRYGFHGLSHSWVARRAAKLVGDGDGDGDGDGAGAGAGAGGPGGLRVVSCHLGAGASLCAIRGGASVDTTMGFTPLEGLVMATRSGSVDPGMLLWLLEREAVTERQMAEALEHESGIRGLAGTADMRTVVERATGGRGADDGAAALALDVYVHRLRAAIAAMTAALGGLDVLVFTGGVGERSAPVRARAAEGLAFLGVRLDEERNRGADPDAEIGAPDAAVRTFVVRAREDVEMARQARAALAGRAG